MRHLFALCLACGCAVTPPAAGDDPGEPPTGPLPSTGPYQLVTRVDITAEALLPGQAAQIVSTLRLLATNPARALITAAGEAGVPAAGTLHDVLPDALEGRLEGWLNDEIAKVTIDGVPVTGYAGEIAALADTALAGFDLASELAIHGSTADHRLLALDLSPAGVADELPLVGLPGDVVTQQPRITIERGVLGLGDQRFGLAYGDYAWRAIEAASRSRFGGDVRDVLGAAIRCPEIARSVAARCVLDVCVGHEAELTSLCEDGLDAIVDLAHDRFAETRLDVLRLASGQATLVDGDGDGIAERVTRGSWQAELDVGQGLRHVPASFTGAL